MSELWVANEEKDEGTADINSMIVVCGWDNVEKDRKDERKHHHNSWKLDALAYGVFWLGLLPSVKVAELSIRILMDT